MLKSVKDNDYNAKIKIRGGFNYLSLEKLISKLVYFK